MASAVHLAGLRPDESTGCGALLSLVGLALAGALCLLWALAAGEIAVPLGDVFDALAGGGDGMQVAIIRELRLPRAIAAFACGGLLALAGA